MAASASAKPLQQALAQIIQNASVATATHVDPAVQQLTESQDGLEAELRRLDDEMASVTSVLETVTLDPETSARMKETQECLKRTKKKLITIRGRLGRLRTYEEGDRLRLTERSLDVFYDGSASVGAVEDTEGSNVLPVVNVAEEEKVASFASIGPDEEDSALPTQTVLSQSAGQIEEDK